MPAFASVGASNTSAMSMNRPGELMRTAYSALRIMSDEYTNPDGKTNISVKNYRDIRTT